MDAQQLTRLQAIVDGLFREARRQHQAAKLEKKRSERRPQDQVPHPYDHVVDVICKDLGLKNPGTDQHSLNIWPHPVDGWPPDTAEKMRRERVRQTWERGRPEDIEWLAQEGLFLNKDGWVRRKDERVSYGG